MPTVTELLASKFPVPGLAPSEGDPIEEKFPFPKLSSVQWEELAAFLNSRFPDRLPAPMTSHLDFVIASAQRSVVRSILFYRASSTG